MSLDTARDGEVDPAAQPFPFMAPPRPVVDDPEPEGEDSLETGEEP